MKLKQQSLFQDNGASFSPCRLYRYSLWRFWNKPKGYVAFMCLNPSTADETNPDPTVTRCINFANSWGYGGMMMLNLFAYRSTDPKQLLMVTDPVGPENDIYIRNASSRSDLTIIAWGVDKAIGKRSDEVLKLLKDPHYLALTKNGSPWHPLYLKGSLKPVPFKIKA